MKLPPENECGCAEYKYKFDENVLTKKQTKNSKKATFVMMVKYSSLMLDKKKQ